MEWKQTEDEYGLYLTRKNENGIEETHIQYTAKWYEENLPQETELKPPTETELLTDYIVDVDYRVTMIELGL